MAMEDGGGKEAEPVPSLGEPHQSQFKRLTVAYTRRRVEQRGRGLEAMGGTAAIAALSSNSSGSRRRQERSSGSPGTMRLSQVLSTPEATEARRKRNSEEADARRKKARLALMPSTATLPGLQLTVLLPNYTSVKVQVARDRPASLQEVLDRLRLESRSGEPPLDREREIDWSSAWLDDPSDARVEAIRTQEQFAAFCASSESTRMLLLVDGQPNNNYGDNQLWNVTPEPAMLTRLPQGYKMETALADQVDNALQAVWTNTGIQRLISVDIERDKITIFDNGKGMTAEDGENCIVKWGTLGSSSHRVVHHQAMGSRNLPPPFLLPYLGKYGAGAVASALHLGSKVTVWSKTAKSKMVCSLVLDPEKLKGRLKEEPAERFWEVNGNLRKMSKSEHEKAPSGSFTKVEITGLQKQYDFFSKDGDKEGNLWKENHVKQMLKDIYAPYIQCDQSRGTTCPVTFEVNGQNLTEVEGGEVTASNKHSCPGEPFVIDMNFRMTLEEKSVDSTLGANCETEANARLCCHYFPNTKGKEALDAVLEDVRSIRPGETFQTMARVGVRWLGRLLPETRWGLLPFMEFRPKQHATLRPLWTKRVKAFLDTDAGFQPTQAKTELDRDHPFTVAVQKLGASEQELSKTTACGVKVYLRRDGKFLAPDKLAKEYMGWLKLMHEKFDEEVTFGENDRPTIVMNHEGLSNLPTRNGLPPRALRFHLHIKDAKNEWDLTTVPMRIKLQKGSDSTIKRDLYATIEHFFHEFSDRDDIVDCEVWMVCRPMDVPDTLGCSLRVVDMVFDLKQSIVFPVAVLNSDKCQRVSEQQWERRIEDILHKSPSRLALLDVQESQSLGINEAFPVGQSVFNAGYVLPSQFLAVVRVKHVSGSSKQASICTEALQLKMTVTFPSRKSCNPEVYEVIAEAETLQGVKGLYLFSTKNARLGQVLTTQGYYVFQFSLVSEKYKEVVPLEYQLKVEPADETVKWEIFPPESPPEFRLGEEMADPGFGLRKLDGFGNYQSFRDQANVNLAIQVLTRFDDVLNIKAVWKALAPTADNEILMIKNLSFNTADLSPIKPKYEAALLFSLPSGETSGPFPIKVLPGRLVSMEMKTSETEISEPPWSPGEVITELLFQGLDMAGNTVDSSQSVLVELDGLEFMSKQSRECKFQLENDGSLDLGDVLKVSGDYGSSGSVVIKTTGGSVLLEVPFSIVSRMLRFSSEVPKKCVLGQELKDLVIEVIDEDGIPDSSMDGGLHCLQFDWDQSSLFPIKAGKCLLPPFNLPSVPGYWRGGISHSQSSTLTITLTIEMVIDAAVRLTAEAERKHEEAIKARNQESFVLKFNPVAANGQPGTLSTSRIKKFEAHAEMVKSSTTTSNVLPIGMCKVSIRGIEPSDVGYAARLRLTGPAGVYDVYLTDPSIKSSENGNMIRRTVFLRAGAPHKLLAFMGGGPDMKVESEPLLKVKVPRLKMHPALDVYAVDEAGNVCSHCERSVLRMSVADCNGWGAGTAALQSGKACFDPFPVTVDTGTYRVSITPGDKLVCAAAHITLDVVPGNYPVALHVATQSLVVSLDGKDVQYLPHIEVFVETADGMAIQERVVVALTIPHDRDATSSDGQQLGELVAPVPYNGGLSSVESFSRIPAPVGVGHYRVKFSVCGAAAVPPVFLPFQILHGPPASLAASWQQQGLTVQVFDQHGNLCKGISGLQLTLQFGDGAEVSTVTVYNGLAVFGDLLYLDLPSTWCQFQVFLARQENPQHAPLLEAKFEVIRTSSQGIAQHLKEAEDHRQTILEIEDGATKASREIAAIKEAETSRHLFIAKTQAAMKVLGQKVQKLTANHQDDAAILEMERQKGHRSEKEIFFDLQKRRERRGYAAALSCLFARMEGGYLFAGGGNEAATDILGVVATLGRVEDDSLNLILAEFTGSSMLMIVCKTQLGVNALEAGGANGEHSIHATARTRSLEIRGRYTALALTDVSWYRGQVLRGHPQQLLNISPPQMPDTGQCPPGFLGYAVNLIHLREEQLRITVDGKEVGLRESLFFDLYKHLMVFDTKRNILAFKSALQRVGRQLQGAVSLDKAIFRSNGRQELGYGSSSDVGLMYATVPYAEREVCSLFPPASDAFERKKRVMALEAELDKHNSILAERMRERDEAQILHMNIESKLKELERVKMEIKRQRDQELAVVKKMEKAAHGRSEISEESRTYVYQP